MLQAQLAQSKSLNAAILKSHKNVDSYLFSPQQAALHDLDELYALATNGLQFLASSQSSYPRKRTKDHHSGHNDLRSILNNSPLFLPSARVMRDRTTLNPDENDRINNEVDDVLYAISPWLTQQAAGGVIEWLVRRYRVHEFNVETLLAVFLPYHTTQHFIKLVSILHISSLSPYHALLAPHKKSFTPLPLASITAAMSTNSLFANKILAILPSHVMRGAEHHAVVGWSLGVGMQYIESMAGKNNEEALAALLPNLSKAFGTTRDIDTASTYILLFTHLASRVALTSTTTAAILHSLASIKAPVPPTHITMSASLILLNQDSQDLPESFIRFILGLTKDEETMTKSSQHIVSPAILRPVAAALCAFLNESESEGEVETKDKERAYTLLDHLIRSSYLTPEGAAIIGQALLVDATDSDSLQTNKLTLLRSLYLLHPDQLQLALRNVKESRSDAPEVLEQLVVKVTLPMDMDDFTDEDGAKMGIVLASSAESSLRARGVRILLAKREMETAEVEADAEVIRELLLARLEDPSSEVIHALYSDPTKLAELIGYPKVMSALEDILRADVPVDILSLHAAFLFKAVISEDKRSGRVGTMLFPFLLLTKGGFKRSKAVWTSLLESSITATEDEMMKGAKDLVKHVDWKELKGDVNAMAALNERIVGLLAGNIAHSDAYMHILAHVLKQAKGSIASSSKTLALLLVYTLLKTLEGPKRLALGIAVVKMFTETGLTLEGAEGKETEKVDFHRVVSKPEHQSTYTRIYAAILLLLPTIQNPDGSSETANWFSQSQTTHEAQYAHFTRVLYTLLNSSSSSPTVYTQSLRSLFIVVRDSSLLLLSSIWTDRRSSASIRLVALKHAHAFIKALMNESDVIERDLQMIFPLLLGGLWEADEEIRREVAACIRLIAGAKPNGRAPEIYGLKVLPAGITEKIKFLDWQDFSSYANALATRLDTLELDSSALTMVQETVLSITPQSSGKESRYKRRVLSYLLSHACAWHSIDIRLPLLASTSTIPDPGKLQAVTPLIQELASGKGPDMPQRLDPRQQEVYVDAVLSSLSYAEDIPASSTLSALFELLQKFYETEENETALRDAPTALMVLVRLLNSAQRLQLCHLLVSVIKKSTPSAHLKLLASALDDEQTLVTLLKELRPLPSDEQPTKRARLETVIPPFTKLTTVCQALSLSSSRRSIGVLRAMLDSLDGTLDTRGMEPTEVAHVQQSIMTALSHMAQFVSNTAESNAQLRIDVLVNLIKGSENPQIIHQTLLLVASLAQWSSDSLLHHLMPILLSTGSYISPRDDLYSARVAEKTIDSVIPLLTSHLRSNYPNKANLQTAARPYLLIFTDACTSMPPHRRTSFFTHLLSILGPADFLNPICLLLLDPAVASIKTQSERMELAVGITLAQISGVRLAALSELLEDLVAELSLSHGSELAAMRAESVESEENRDQTSKVLDYINQVLDRSRGFKVEKDEHPQRILGALVRLLAIPENLQNRNSSQSLRRQLSSALMSASRIVPPSTVLYTCLQLLRCNDAALQIELYTLLAARLGDVTQEARGKMSDDMVLMIKVIKETLATASASKSKVASLTALHAIAKSARSTELSALMELVPVATSCIQDSIAAPFAVDALNDLCGTLGPRIIPHLSSVVQTTCSLLRSGSVSDSSISASTSLLRRLLDVAASFWTVADTECVLFVHIKESAHKRGQTQELLKSLGKQTAKKISTHVFVEAFVRVWKTIEQEDNFTERDIAFAVLRHAIKAADRLQIGQESRILLSVFLEAWDTQKIMEDDSASIKAFVELVVKLNDSSFKPLYRKMFDWAWSTGNESKIPPDDTRAIAYCQAMNASFSLLKSLMTPYLAPLVGRASEILDSWSQAPEAFDHFDLWTKLMGLIKRSLDVDDGAFWREEFVRILAPALVRQVPITADLQRPWMAESLGDTLGALGALSDTYLKTLNVDLLMHTRSEEARVRISALRSLSRVWLVNGHQLAGWKRETIPFLHECAEDENEDVVHEARGLKAILDKF